MSTSQLETLNYEYNLRGWLKDINKGFVTTAGSSSNWFAQELSYDYGFATNQYNGNISGNKWKSKSNGIQRAYGYNYDNASRLSVADYTQQNSGSTTWTRDQMDFSVSGITYDANGNIGTMTQKGMVGAAITTIDQLTYGYKNTNSSNRLASVADPSSTATAKLGDFINGTNSGDDYEYDVNGNLTKDRNKSIDTILYNHLNLPESITIAGKGNIQYQYDATGNKLKKTVTDNTVTPSKITTTTYIGSFVYRNDTLQFVSHGEGRIRTVFKDATPVSYVYDYFLKDHLGNVRTVLTEQTDFSMYAATMETEQAATETALFSNLDETRTAKPVGYPQDETTPKNHDVAKLNAKDGGKKIGPSLVLRVMAGDTIQIGARAFYKSTGPKDKKTVSPEDMVASLLQVFGGTAASSNSHAARQAENLSPFRNFNSNDYQRLKEKDADQNQQDKPKAYLNFALFDDQFNLVDQNSGVRQVKGEPDELQTLAVDKMPIEKSGFLYVYTSNETAQDVFFDNVVVQDISGPLLEETHYYPFGLTMAGISSKVIGGTRYPENLKKYNYIDNTTELDLNQYDAFYRTLDPQIGRWRQIDPMVEYFKDFTPYGHVLNNPITISDPLGDDTVQVNNLPEVWHDFNPDQDVVRLNGVFVSPNKNAQADYLNNWPNTGYKVMQRQSWLMGFVTGTRSFHGYEVSNQGILTDHRLPITGVPGPLIEGASLGGLSILKIGNSIRRIIAEVKWSSKTVRIAAKLLMNGAEEVTVNNRNEAEELFRHLYLERGYKNSTGMKPYEAKDFFGKEGYYHWDDVFDESGRIIGHGPENPHGDIMHLQIHNENGEVTRIFFN